MINVEFKRQEKVKICNGCERDIYVDEPCYTLEIKNNKITLCEDCGCDLQNDMSDEYCRFVDLGM